MSSNTKTANLFSRLAEMPSKPTLLRDEIDVVFDEVMAELFGPDPDGDEIVPQKLAKLFPGPLGATADKGTEARLIVSVNRIERLQELPTAELSTRDRRNEWSGAFHG